MSCHPVTPARRMIKYPLPRTVSLTICLALLLTSQAAPQTQTTVVPPKPTTPVLQSIGPGLTRGYSLRNENVQVNRIDNDALKEANIRQGDTVTIVSQPRVETGYYATEHGRPPGEPVALRAADPLDSWHVELFEYLQNSVFNARTFFQVGPVLPSRQNRYGARFTGILKPLGDLTGSFSQQKVRGMVNGNVLVPLASERTPLATDSATRAIVARFLAAYPDVLPNRPDFDARALNTNSPQRIDQTDASLRLDRAVGEKGRLSASHALSRQRIDAFQFVAGQNPDTRIHSQRSRLAYHQAWSASSETAFGGGFTRVTSVLVPEPHSVGPRVRIGYQIEELGPDSQFPINRAQNSFRFGAVSVHRVAESRHTITWGGDIFRFQHNGIETSNSRGLFWFSSNFGRTAIENLRYGAPTSYEVTIGPMDRGFRSWEANLFLADQWKVGPRLQIYYGLRYNLQSTPHEVNHINTIPYPCDCNNFSPRFSLAWRITDNWVLRTGYTVSFGQIFPVTYQQIRYNLPVARAIQVQTPDLVSPLRTIDLTDPNVRTAPTFLSPDLVSPYTHQYNLTIERRFEPASGGSYIVRAGYLGSRTFKLLDSFIQNRAVPVPGIPLITDTVDLRRADPRYYEVKHIVNGGAAYLDAAQVSVEAPYRRGLMMGATYTFGKAIDTGSDYSGTAANRDLVKGRSQSQYGSFQDKKGLSNFDSTHALTFYTSYDLPKVSGEHGWVGSFANGWQVSGAVVAKTGTPLTLYIGSDAPGFGNVDGGSGDRPNILDPSILGRTIGNPDTAPLILRPDRFGYLQPGLDRGSLGRNNFRKGGIANLNGAVTKQWHWGANSERTFLLRGEAINLMNHPQFDEPQRNLSAPAFGKITNTLNDGRVLQLGLRVLL